jgi:hypothetical protein
MVKLMSTILQTDQQEEIDQLKAQLRDTQILVYKLWKKAFPDEEIDISNIWMDI